MTDQPHEERSADEDELLRDEIDELGGELVAQQAVATGNPAVDEVLATLDTLNGLPVDEHVAVFEQAHEQLRRTLSGAGDDQA